MDRWTSKRILITGVCGTIGKELLRQLSNTRAARIIGIDNNETDLFFLSQDYQSHGNIDVFFCDIRDRRAVSRMMRDMDIVLHAAALKHVISCEQSPRDAVSTNIKGMTHIIDAAEANGVERVIFTSSDKAVNPTNVMGTTKLMGERLITAANAQRHEESDTIYASTRFGNVLGSRGSVVPLFMKQIQQGGPVTLTDPAMTRFIMTKKQAVHLVLESTFMAQGGEVFVTKMPVIRIVDLARVMIETLAPAAGFSPEDIEIRTIGAKPGEKMYEELLSHEEIGRTMELERFFSILPAFKGLYQNIDYQYDGFITNHIEKPYHSANEPALSREEIRSFIDTHQVFEEIL